MNGSLVGLILVLGWTTVLVQHQCANIVLDALHNLVEPMSTSYILSQAGFKARVHNIPTEPGYWVNLVEIINPAIEGTQSGQFNYKEPVMFVHGFFTTSNVYVALGSKGGRPSDWSSYDAGQMSQGDLEKLIGRDKASRSLPLLLANFGHPVWLLNLRSTKMALASNPDYPKDSHAALCNLFKGKLNGLQLIDWTSMLMSQKEFQTSTSANLEQMEAQLRRRIGDLKSHNHSFWDFSYDEQAAHDMPAAIRYILSQPGMSGKKINLIGHSAGGLLIGQTLVARPDLWPNMNLHYISLNNPVFQLLRSVEPMLSQLNVPLSQALLTPFVAINAPFCMMERLSGHICDDLMDDFLGTGTNQLDLTSTMDMMFSFGHECSAHEFAQLLQAGQKNQVGFFDFNDPKKNLAHYGSLDVPKYDFSTVKLGGISIWQGNTDRLVNHYDMAAFAKQFPVPVETHVIGNTSEGVLFNHGAFILHQNIVKYLNIPILRTLAQEVSM